MGFKGQFGGQGFQMLVGANSLHVLFILKANRTTEKKTILRYQQGTEKECSKHICDLVGKHYFILTDYNSRIFQIAYLPI